MKRKRSSRQSSTRSSLDQRYDQLLDELRRSIRREWSDAASPGESTVPERVGSFIDSADAIIAALKQIHSEQARKIEKLEVLLYDLEGRQQYIEETVVKEHHAEESKFLTSLNRWIADIDREAAREL